MKLITRLHEMAADRFSFIQYPNIRGPKPQFFTTQMNWPLRIFVATISLVTICVCALVLAGLLYWAYFLFIA
ncbi:MAG: hypothetical protein K2Y28_10790 [Burkholderiaceae bacterium]|nr:hypothetical protein [Burkholderiaceae bacterium]